MMVGLTWLGRLRRGMRVCALLQEDIVGEGVHLHCQSKSLAKDLRDCRCWGDEMEYLTEILTYRTAKRAVVLVNGDGL